MAINPMQERGNGPELMPTVLIIGPYRFFFYAGDREEPPHVHVEREDKSAKFWLDPVRMQRSGGFSRREIARVQRIIIEHHEKIKEAWSVYFGK